MRRLPIFAVVATLCVVACGRSEYLLDDTARDQDGPAGDDDGDASGGDDDDADAADDGDSLPNDGDATPPAPAVAVTFPPGVFSIALDATVVVRGRGTDLRAVTVNGTAATTTDAFATWSASVPVAEGTQELSISAESNAGALLPVQRISIDRGTAFRDLRSAEWNATNANLVVLDRLEGVHTIAPSNGARQRVGAIDPFATSLAFDTATQRIYLAHAAAGASVEGANIVRMELGSGAVTTIASETIGTGVALVDPAGLALTDDGRLLVLERSPASVVAIDLTTLTRSILSDAASSGPAFTPPVFLDFQVGAGRALAAQVGQLLAVNATTGARSLISGTGTGTGALFNSPSAACVAGTRAWITDSLVLALHVIDLPTGNRSFVSSPTTGGGPLMVTPVDVTVDVPGNRAFVLDSGQLGLLNIDLATGTRTLLARTQIGPGPAPRAPRGIAPVPAQNVLMITDRDDTGTDPIILRVDLRTGERTLFAGRGVGTGVALSQPSGITVQPSRQRVLYVDTASRALVAVDLTTGQRTLVSGDSRGSGTAFVAPTALALDDQRGRCIVLDGGLVQVELTTGNRTVLSSASVGSGPALVSPRGLAINSAGDRALVLETSPALALVQVVLSTGARSVVSSSTVGTGPLYSEGRWLRYGPGDTHALTGGATATEGLVLEVDLSTGNRSVVAQHAALFGTRDGATSDDGSAIWTVGDEDSVTAIDRPTGNKVLVSR